MPNSPTSTKNCRCIYLDMNIWINIAESTTTEATTAKEALLHAVNQGRLLCPVSAPLMWELMRQEHDSATRIAHVMERASHNLAFRSREEMNRQEVRALINQLLKRKTQENETVPYLVPVAGYLASTATLEFPTPWNNNQATKFASEVEDRLNRLTLTELIAMRRDDCGQPPRDPPPYQDAWKNRRAIAGNSKVKARRAELEWVWREQVTPVLLSELDRVEHHEHSTFWRSVERLPTDRWGGQAEAVIALLPSATAYIDVITASGYDVNQKPRITDWFDLEHLICALPYATAFASHDRWIRTVYEHVIKNGKGDTCQFLGSLQEITQYAQHA